LTKVIVVEGISSSGKTSSIRKFAENHGIFAPLSPRDFILVITIQKHGKSHKICVVTGGDNPSMIKAGVDFGLSQSVDVIVCATKSSGATVAYMNSLVSTHGLNRVTIPTNWVDPTLSSQTAEHIRVASEIDKNIP
jgi:hypothetical protein